MLLLIRFAGGLLALIWVLFFASGVVTSASDDDPASDEAAKKFQAYAKEQAQAYKAFGGKASDRKLTLAEQPILRWTNPLGGRNAHGEVFLWTDNSRPAAVLSLYEYTDTAGVVHEHHEFCSLTREGLSFTSGKVTWNPREAGVEFRPFGVAPAPAVTARQRLTQMRELAGWFTAAKTTREGETRDLRVLPQPVHRYQGEGKELLDGGLFAFVEHTDPEVFLLLEAHLMDGKPAWHYALARMNSIQMSAALREKPVWEASLLPWRDALNRKDKPYTAFSVR
jgi:hypothetical protein